MVVGVWGRVGKQVAEVVMTRQKIWAIDSVLFLDLEPSYFHLWKFIEKWLYNACVFLSAYYTSITCWRKIQNSARIWITTIKIPNIRKSFHFFIVFIPFSCILLSFDLFEYVLVNYFDLLCVCVHTHRHTLYLFVSYF